MHICQDHWHELRNAIRQRGLWKLVKVEGYFAANISMQELECRAAQSALDPLMATSLLISDQARMAFGSGGAVGRECPLCIVEQNLGKETAIEWIDADADFILQIWRDRHLADNQDF